MFLNLFLSLCKVSLFYFQLRVILIVSTILVLNGAIAAHDLFSSIQYKKYICLLNVLCCGIYDSIMVYVYLTQMAKYFNERSDLPGHIPLGGFNAMFNFSGSWQLDAAATKSLAMVGCNIPLFTVKLAKANLILRDEIRRAVPYSWDSASLAR